MRRTYFGCRGISRWFTIGTVIATAAAWLLTTVAVITAADGVVEEQIVTSSGGGGGGGGIISIKEIEDSISRPLDQASFPPLDFDSYKPPRAASKPSHLTPEEAAALSEEEEDDEESATDGSGEDEEDFLSACVASEKERLTTLLGTGEAAKSSKIRRQVKAVAKRSCDAQVAERQYFSYLTDPLPIVPPTVSSGGDDDDVDPTNTTSAANDQEESDVVKTSRGAPQAGFLSRINPIQSEMLAPSLIDWPKQVKMVDRLKESAKDSKLLRNELQHEKIASSAEEAPLLGYLVSDLESRTLIRCTSVLKQLDEHKKFQLALMMTLPPAISEAEKSITESSELKKLKALGKYASTRAKRSTGADLAEQYEMLYVHHAVKGRVQTPHNEERDNDNLMELIPENSLSSLRILPSPLWSFVLTDVSSLQGLAVWIFITTLILVLLPWAIWLGSFIIVLGIGMWRKNPPAGGGRRLGTGGGDSKISLVSLPYRSWQFTTFFGFRLGVIAILFYTILMVDRKYFFPFKAGLPLTLLVFNVKYFFTQSTISLLYGVVLSVSFSLSGAVLSLTSSASSRSSRNAAASKKTKSNDTAARGE